MDRQGHHRNPDRRHLGRRQASSHKAQRRPDGMSQTTGSTGIAGGKIGYVARYRGASSRPNGGSEKEDSAAANQASYSVFWWSSRTIRAASMRRAVLKGTMTQADAEKTSPNVPDEYMILVQGTNMQIFQHRGEEAFEKVAYLQLKEDTSRRFIPPKLRFLRAAMAP